MQAMSDRFDRTDAGPAVLDVDRLLSEFYQAEMPDPWPRVKRPVVVPFRRPVAKYSRTFRRLAIAATLVLALLGYWAVAGFFPREGRSGPDIDGQEIGLKNGHKAPNKQLSPVEHMRTLSGRDAQTFNEDLPDSKAMIIIETPNPKGLRP
jgi:hypothetical protein